MIIKQYKVQIVNPNSDVCPRTGQCLDSVYEMMVNVISGPGEVVLAYLLGEIFSPSGHWVTCVWCPDDKEEDDEF